jgi:Zn-dependent protease/CBS domain-containing protein
MAGAARAAAATRGSLTLVRVRGVPVRAHWSLALGLPFFAWVMGAEYFGSTLEGYAWGAALAVSLFVSVAIHELAHSLVAMRLGTPIREIILLPIGGASVMASTPREPGKELKIAVVGPVTSLVLGVLLLGAALAARIPLANPALLPHPQGFILAAAYVNGTLGIFNLVVPAFPMDGGRVMRALLAGRLGLARATSVAAGIGRGLAVLMGIGGLLSGDLLLLLIAVFVWAGASTEERSVQLTTALDGVRLGDIMTTEPATVPPGATVDEALHAMLETKHLALPIVEAQHPIGVVTSADIVAVPPPERRVVTVREVARSPLVEKRPDAPAAEVAESLAEASVVAVVDDEERLLGVVTATDLSRAVQLLRIARGEGARPARGA